ncbi:MAG: hypothetical protein ACAI38_17020 [Myxococcota bacterium]|nr:hypothetical protein [Myxococcota bacterium]
MKLRRSKLALVAIAGFALAGATACNGDEKPVQDVTFLTFGAANGGTAALGYSADRGLHLASIDGTSVLNMAIKGQVDEEEERGGGGGGGFFSGSTGGSASFSGSTGGSTSFSGGTGTSVGFSGSTGASASFSGTVILNGASCDLSAICDIVEAICADAEADCGDFSGAQCRASVNDPRFQEGLAEAFADSPELAAVFCALIDFLACLFDNAGSLEDISEATANQCAQQAGLVDLISSGGLDDQRTL